MCQLLIDLHEIKTKIYLKKGGGVAKVISLNFKGHKMSRKRTSGT